LQVLAAEAGVNWSLVGTTSAARMDRSPKSRHSTNPALECDQTGDWDESGQTKLIDVDSLTSFTPPR
jgi:hypothetical protein